MSDPVRTLKNVYHWGQGVIANLVYGFPSRKLKLIGVTGTDGKTTTTSLIYHILKSAGKKASMISTVYAQIAGETNELGFHVTTPSRFEIQQYLKRSADHGDEYFVLEVTSHSLDQWRVWGVNFTIGVITNVTHEHLDYHKTYEKYVAAKTRLLQNSQICLVNRDDQSYPLVTRILEESANEESRLVTFGLENKADYQLNIAEKIGQPLASFNNYNFLVAYAICKELGLGDEVIFSAMKTFKLPPGRMEIVYQGKFTVIIDFAHTPNAFRELFKTLRQPPFDKNTRLIHVFSSAALRDESKRPFMGEESGKVADLVILTEEDYRNEDPNKIDREIAVGLQKQGFQEVSPELFGSKTKTYTIITDRKKAIEKALQTAQVADLIILTGKGHERSLCRGTIEYPWSEKEAVLGGLTDLGISI